MGKKKYFCKVYPHPLTPSKVEQRANNWRSRLLLSVRLRVLLHVASAVHSLTLASPTLQKQRAVLIVLSVIYAGN